MRVSAIRGVIIFFCGLVFHQNFGQELPIADNSVLPSYKHAVVLYDRSVKSQSLIYNGPEFKEQNLPAKGHSFFVNDYLEEGDINYEGEQYSNIPMLYDLVLDRIIIEHFDQGGRGVQLVLHEERIKGFVLYGHSFIRLSEDSLNHDLRPGFYDLLYDGNVKALAKRRKNVTENVTQNGVEMSYDTKDYYLLYREGVYYTVNSQRAILRVLKDRKKMLNQFIKNSALDFRLNKENSIVEVVKYYDNLK